MVGVVGSSPIAPTKFPAKEAKRPPTWWALFFPLFHSSSIVRRVLAELQPCRSPLGALVEARYFIFFVRSDARQAGVAETATAVAPYPPMRSRQARRRCSACH